MSNTLPQDLITTKQAADLLHVDQASVRRWIATGKLTGYQVVGRLRVSRADVLALITPIVPLVIESRREHEARQAEVERILRRSRVI